MRYKCRLGVPLREQSCSESNGILISMAGFCYNCFLLFAWTITITYEWRHTAEGNKGWRHCTAQARPRIIFCEASKKTKTKGKETPQKDRECKRGSVYTHSMSNTIVAYDETLDKKIQMKNSSQMYSFYIVKTRNQLFLTKLKLL